MSQKVVSMCDLYQCVCNSSGSRVYGTCNSVPMKTVTKPQGPTLFFHNYTAQLPKISFPGTFCKKNNKIKIAYLVLGEC